jgi:hypothetical protein
LIAQVHEFLVLLDEHGQEHDLERQEVGGVGGGGQMAARSGQEVVEGDLILAAQGAAEAGERLLLGEKGLGDGGKGAAHKNLVNGDPGSVVGGQAPEHRVPECPGARPTAAEAPVTSACSFE